MTMTKEILSYLKLVLLLPFLFVGGVFLIVGATAKSVGYLLLFDADSARKEKFNI